MNYPLKSSSSETRRRNSRKKVFLGIVFLVLILALLSTTVAKNFLFFISQPVWSLKNYLFDSSSDSLDFFKSKGTLINEKQLMQKQIFEAGTLSALNSVLQTENDTLKDLLGRKTIKEPGVLAAILSKPPQNAYDVLVVDAGQDLGIKIGDKVVADANVYLGEVSEVYPNSSKVTLYSSPGEKRSVVLGENSVTAEAVGLGGGNFSILLPREIEVKEGDVIVIPSITPNVFGIVEKVSFEDKDSFQTVLFKSPVNVSELRFVEIIL